MVLHASKRALRESRRRPWLLNITAAGAVDREFGNILDFVFDFGPKMGSRRARRGFKRSLEAVGFILAEFELKRSHGDPIRDIFCGFGTRELARLCLRERYRYRYITLYIYIYINVFTCVFDVVVKHNIIQYELLGS